MGSGTAESLVPSKVTLLRPPDAENYSHPVKRLFQSLNTHTNTSADSELDLGVSPLQCQCEGETAPRKVFHANQLDKSIIGTLDPKTDLISVRSIEPATASSGKKSAAK